MLISKEEEDFTRIGPSLAYTGAGTQIANMQAEASEIKSVASQIKAHFLENPQAAETLEGIVRWWLLRQQFNKAWTTVSSALNELVEQGFLRRIKNPGGKVVYSLARNEK